jgi:hypothetical protein
MHPSTSQTGHSADVQMKLRVNGFTLGIAQLGQDFLVLEQPIDLPPSPAEVFLSIDGRESTWPVFLADGINSQIARTRIG